MGTKKADGGGKKRGRTTAWEYFDDCAVCQAMKFAKKHGREATFSELRETFSRTGPRQN